MKNYTVILLIIILSGCQSDISMFSEENLSTLSNEELCRALGTYNNDGCLVLKIYNELNRRPQKIDTERCYVIEKISYAQQRLKKNPPVMPYGKEPLSNPDMQNKLPLGILSPEEKKLLQHDRARYRIKRDF